MPYKNKEDRTEAVRRHRDKKKRLSEALRLEAEVTDFLKGLEFVSLSWDEFFELTQEFKKDEEGIFRLADGKRIYPPEEIVFLVNTAFVW